LKNHIKLVRNSISQPWVHSKQWQAFISDVAKLCDSVEKYVKYLENVNYRMRYIHTSSLPIRNGIDNIKVEDIEASQTIAPEYEEFNHLLQETELYIAVCLNEFIPKNKIERFDFFDKFQLKVDCTTLVEIRNFGHVTFG
jgi:hypothetical protein